MATGTNCASLESGNTEFVTYFDDDKGYIYLIGGDDCWQDVEDGIEEVVEAIVEGTATTTTTAEEGECEYLSDDGECSDSDNSEGSIDDSIEFSDWEDDWEDYTDGYMLVTKWKWNETDVAASESAGLCVSDGTNYASCWTWKRNALNDAWEDKHTSWLLPSDLITSTLVLEDYAAGASPSYVTSLDLFPGIGGSWWCDSPNYDADAATFESTCFRFLPDESVSSSTDFRFQPGEHTISTYLTTRGIARLRSPHL